MQAAQSSVRAPAMDGTAARQKAPAPAHHNVPHILAGHGAIVQLRVLGLRTRQGGNKRAVRPLRAGGCERGEGRCRRNGLQHSRQQP